MLMSPIRQTYIEADKATYFGKLENYEEDLIAILGQLIPDLITAKEISARIRQAGQVDFWKPLDGKVKPYQEFYTLAQRDLVAKLEEDIIKRFEYTFDDIGRNYH